MKKVFWVPEHLAKSLSSSCVQCVCVCVCVCVCLVSLAQTPFKLSFAAGSILAEIDQHNKDYVRCSLEIM